MSNQFEGRLVIGDDTPTAEYEAQSDGRARGLIPRDYSAYPVGFYAAAPAWDMASLPLVPWDEIPDRIAHMEETKTRLIDLVESLDPLDQNGQGYCVPAGTLIRMADGTQKPIELVRLSDKVVTAEGNVGKVYQTNVRDHADGLFEIQMFGHNGLRCTGEHPVLTKRGYIQAKDLVAGDMVRLPKYRAEQSNVLQTHLHINGVKRRVKNYAGSAQWETSIPNEDDRSSKLPPEFIELNRNSGRIFGLYLAEGSTRSNAELSWAFCTDEEHTLVAELAELLQSEWGVTPLVRQLTDSVIEVRLQGVMWVQLFASLFGRGSSKKTIHADLLCGSDEFLAGLFSGWMDGDGTRKLLNGNPNTPMRLGCSVSKSLALSMFDIANNLGMQPSFMFDKPQVNKHASTRKTPWFVKVLENPGCNSREYRMIDEPGALWRRILKTKHAPGELQVYNIAVEGDNSYVADGVGVHNCWFYSGTAAIHCLRMRNNQPNVRLSAHSGACVIKNFRDEGGWGAQGLDFQKERGVVPVSRWPEKSMDRQYNTEANWEAAKEFRPVEGFVDLNSPQYDRELTVQQIISCYLNRIPVISDFNWWGHSVCGLWMYDYKPNLRKNDPNRYAANEILNSWGRGWGQNGRGILKDSKAFPNGASAPRATWGN